jgi:hypothetical protein
MHTDENLITSIRTAIEDGTADIHYRGVVPTPSMYPSRWTALPMAAAVAAVAALGAVAVTSSGHDGPTAANRVGVGRGTAGHIVNNDVMLASSLTHAARGHRLAGQHAAPGKGGAADGCLLPAGDDDACYTQPEPPYPFLMEIDASVPSDATPYPELTGLDGGVVKAWAGEDTRTGRGASVWLKYPDETLEVSATYFSTGDQLADYLVQQGRPIR